MKNRVKQVALKAISTLRMGDGSLSFCLLLVISFIPLSAVCNAEIYKWIDRDGNTHFSDYPPDEENISSSPQIIDDTVPELIQGHRINRVVYKDKVFKIVLLDEKDDSLTFELSYKKINQAFPEIFEMDAEFYICAGNNESTYTYLSYDAPKIEGSDNTVTLVNKMSELSPSKIKTYHLGFQLYQKYRDANRTLKIKSLFIKRIPFEKIWSKSK